MGDLMIPHPLTLLILILAAYRLTRLAGWDDFPLAAKLRAWVIGEHWVQETWAHNIEVAPWLEGQGEPVIPDEESATVRLPGKQPPSEAVGVRPAYDRPTVAHLVHCPFCVGFWISLMVFIAWELFPHGSLYAFVPLAISGAVGIIAKNLDA